MNSKNPYAKVFKTIGNLTKEEIPSTKTKIKQTQKQIDNKQTRLKAAGVKNAGDSRNVVEKALNLTPDQNFLFDIFEVLNRPQQALFGGMKESQDGGSFFDGLGEGLKGKRKTQFKNLLMDSDWDFNDRERKIDLVDVLGFAGDVALDPMNFKIIPTGGTEKVTNIAKAADAVGDVAKVAETTPIVWKSATGLLFEGAGKAIKGTAKLADSGVEKALSNLDKAKGINYLNPAAETAAQLGKELEKGSKLVGKEAIGHLETYKEIKDWFVKAFDSSKTFPKKVMDSVRKSNADVQLATAELQVIRDGISKDLHETAAKLTAESGNASEKTIQELAKKLNNDVLAVKEYMNYSGGVIDNQSILNMALEGKLKATEETIDIMSKFVKDISDAERGINLVFDVDKVGNIKLKNKSMWENILHGKGKEALRFSPEVLHEAAKRPMNYTSEQLKELDELVKLFTAEGSEYKKLYDKLDPVFDKANAIVDKHFGTGLIERYQDNEGYMRHAFNKEVFGEADKLGLNPQDFNIKGNTQILADRRYDMSVMEANNMFRDQINKNYDSLNEAQKAFVDNNPKLFLDDFMSSFDDYLKHIPRNARDTKLTNEILIEATFGDFKKSEVTRKAIKNAEKANDPALLNTLKKQYAEELGDVNMKILRSSDKEIPRGFSRLSTDETKKLESKLKTLGSQLKVDSFDEFIKTIGKNRGNIAIDNEIIRLLGVTEPKQVNALVRVYDSYLNFFKRTKVLSPTFQMNNVIGNTSNLALGGVTPTMQFKYFPEAYDIMKEAPDLIAKAAKGEVLTAGEKKMYDTWVSFIKEGFGDPEMSLSLRDMPDSLKGYFTGEKEFKTAKDFLVDGLPYINNHLNQQMDTMSRLVGFMAVNENPKLLQSLNVETAGDAVRKMLFDPRDLTSFETDVMKRIVPFYTFTKKNLAYHIQNLGKNGSRYARLMKGIDSLGEAATEGNYENAADYLKDNLYIPIPGLGKNGEYKMLRAQVPFGDVVDLAGDPLGEIVNKTTPLVKGPIESVVNRHTFNRAPISNFPGEQSKNIPFLTKKQEHLLSQLSGLDVPAKQVGRFIDGMEEGGALGGMGNVLTSTHDIDTDKLYKMYDELEKLDNIMKLYKQKGVKFSTINELKRANKNYKIESLMAKLNKLGGVKQNPYK